MKTKFLEVVFVTYIIFHDGHFPMKDRGREEEVGQTNHPHRLTARRGIFSVQFDPDLCLRF